MPEKKDYSIPESTSPGLQYSSNSQYSSDSEVSAGFNSRADGLAPVTTGQTEQELSAPVLSVSQLNRRVRQLLEHCFAQVVVEGEISNLSTPGSGHLYFSLKDDTSQVRCAMFRNRAALLGFRPSNGDKVQLYAKVSLYEGRGDFQLIAETMEEQGRGALIRAFEALKFRLKEEGLFERSRKKNLPPIPDVIGLITSPTGAAIRDILVVLKRRFPLAKIVIYPAVVQGSQAPDSICRAIELAHLHNRSDLLIIGRGGGSLEDLQAFNDERVARAIAASFIPTVSAVGHETDITIADYVADYRAPTPSAAAEQVSPDLAQWVDFLQHSERVLQRQLQFLLQERQQQLDHLEHRYRRCCRQMQQQSAQLTTLAQRLTQGIRNRILREQQQLEKISGHLRHPKTELQQQRSHLQRISQQLIRACRQQLQNQSRQLQPLKHRLNLCAPNSSVHQHQQQLNQYTANLQKAWLRQHAWQQQQLTGLSQRLQTVSPLATLHRGYAIIEDDKGAIVRHHQSVSTGDTVSARLGTGLLKCKVLATSADSKRVDGD